MSGSYFQNVWRKFVKKDRPSTRDFLAELRQESSFKFKFQEAINSIPQDASAKELALAILTAESLLDGLRKRYNDERNRSE